jgi:hypothetical protein
VSFQGQSSQCQSLLGSFVFGKCSSLPIEKADQDSRFVGNCIITESRTATSMAEAEHYSADQLAHWGLLELARREACRDRLIAAVAEPPEAVLTLLRQQAEVQSQAQGGEPPSNGQLVRQWRWQQWCHHSFAASLASTYLQRKHQLDQVVFWQLRVQEPELAMELYLRLKEAETGFASLGEQEGVQVQRHGPIRLEELPAALATRLRQASSGVVQPPWHWGEVWLVLQLDRLIHAVLDSALQRQLLAEMGEVRLSKEMAQRLPPRQEA